MSHSYLHYVSLSLTPIVYFSLFVVLLHYGTSAVRNGKPTSPAQWLILGIVISMFFKVPDNGFWNGAWSSYLFGEPAPWFTLGPPVNIVCRQLPIIIACFCHWMAECKTSGKKRWDLIGWAALAALAYFACMTFAGITF